jgi:hypothetical protein
LPGTLSRVLASFRTCFAAPAFDTFTTRVIGLPAQLVGRKVCGMLSGVRLERIWHHGRPRRFSTVRWRQVGLLLAELIVTYLLTPGARITPSMGHVLY